MTLEVEVEECWGRQQCSAMKKDVQNQRHTVLNPKFPANSAERTGGNLFIAILHSLDFKFASLARKRMSAQL